MSRRHIYIAIVTALVGGLVFVALRSDDAPGDRVKPPHEPTTDAGKGSTVAVWTPRTDSDEVDTKPTPAHEEGPRLGIYDPATLSEPGGRQLAGWVTDPNGEPVVDAVVSVRNHDDVIATQLSDEQGRFQFERMTPSAVRITADGGPLGFTTMGVAALNDFDAIQMTLEAIGWIQAVVSDPHQLTEAPGSMMVLVTSDADELNSERDFGIRAEATDDYEVVERSFDGDEGHYIVPQTAASGALGTRLAVKAGLTYSVSLRPATAETETDSDELARSWVDCGLVRVLPGETAALDCTPAPREATVTGRLVTTAGVGVEGIKVVLSFPPEADAEAADEADWAYPTVETVTNARGEFSIRVQRRRPTVGDLSTDETRGYAAAQRRQVGIRPGAVTHIGDVMVLKETEVPVGWLDEDFGGIGGLVSLTERGVYLIDVEDNCPLRAAGVEAEDVITRIDGLDAAEMGMPEILKRLRGEVGTDVAIAVRNPMGETWDLNVTRGVIRPGSVNWPERGPQTPSRIEPEAQFVLEPEHIEIDTSAE